MTVLYRTVSQLEKEDFDFHQAFQIGRNTLEAKQFFKSRVAVNQFIANSIVQRYDPAYAHILIVGVDDDCFDSTAHTQKLDGYDAVHVDEDHLSSFNNCIKFVRQEAL
ncbi:MAG: hypothetical protein JST32_03490 [Bacteroidetes bacterium]|nr:hypothetical protein [Bacteroidota bacterium]